jgi:hypothetical protein
MTERLTRYQKLIPVLLCTLWIVCGCSRASIDKATPTPTPQTPRVQEDTLTADALSSILRILLSEDTPMVNLRHNPATEIQVDLPPVRGELPKIIGNVTLLPVDESNPGLLLRIETLSASPDELRIRADVAFFAPEQGFALDGAEWRELIFRRGADGWRLHKALDGAIK